MTTASRSTASASPLVLPDQEVGRAVGAGHERRPRLVLARGELHGDDGPLRDEGLPRPVAPSPPVESLRLDADRLAVGGEEVERADVVETDLDHLDRLAAVLSARHQPEKEVDTPACDGLPRAASPDTVLGHDAQAPALAGLGLDLLEHERAAAEEPEGRGRLLLAGGRPGQLGPVQVEGQIHVALDHDAAERRVALQASSAQDDPGSPERHPGVGLDASVAEVASQALGLEAADDALGVPGADGDAVPQKDAAPAVVLVALEAGRAGLDVGVGRGVPPSLLELLQGLRPAADFDAHVPEEGPGPGGGIDALGPDDPGPERSAHGRAVGSGQLQGGLVGGLEAPGGADGAGAGGAVDADRGAGVGRDDVDPGSIRLGDRVPLGQEGQEGEAGDRERQEQQGAAQGKRNRHVTSR
jgi:hypothetical protein